MSTLKFYWMWILNQTLLAFLFSVRQTFSLFWQILSEGLSFFYSKGFCYSNTWSCNLFEGGTSFYMKCISRKLCRFLIFLTGFTSLTRCLTSFSHIDHFLCHYAPFLMLFKSGIDEVFSINSADLFVFGDFNGHHKVWLTNVVHRIFMPPISNNPPFLVSSLPLPPIL